MCEHKLLRAVGDRLFCKQCGKELDMSFLEGQKQAKNPSDDPGKTKPAQKKTRAKKAE